MAAGGSRRTSSEGARVRSISGPLDVQSASRAIELILEGNLHGSLTISDGLIDVAFFFTRGGLRLICAGKPLPTVRARLAGDNVLSAADLKKVGRLFDSGRNSGRLKAGGRGEERDLLAEAGVGLSSEAIDKASAKVITEVFLDCLFWDDPQYEATIGEPNLEIMQRRDLSAMTLSLGIKDVLVKLQARIRSVSEVRRTVANMQVVAEPTAKGRDAVNESKSLGTGAAAKRRRAFLKKIVQEPGLGAAAIGKHLEAGELEVASRLHELSTEGYVTVSRKARTKKEDLARIREMEEALDAALSQLLRRVRLAADTAGIGDTEGASRHLSRAGGLLLSEGRADEAIHTFQGALKMSEGSLEAREGYVKGLWAAKRESEAAHESEVLGERYLELNLPSRARKVLERALGFEESAGGLQLLVRSLVKLKKPQLASQAGERLVNRLRREGKAEEARDAAAKLMGLGGDKKALLRAAGIDRRKAIVLVAAGAIISLGLLPANAEMASRTEYAEVVQQIQAEFSAGHDLTQMNEVLNQLSVRIEPAARGKLEAHEKADELLAQINDMRADCQQAAELYQILPWREQSDIEAVWAQLEPLEARSEAMAEPLNLLKREVDAYVGQAEERFQTLQRMQAIPAAFALAATLRNEYPNMPRLLDEGTVAVQIISNPPGAKVVYGGLGYSAKTPIEVRVGLRGTRDLVLWVRNYVRDRRTISFDSLTGDLKIVVDLQKKVTTTANRRPRNGSGVKSKKGSRVITSSRRKPKKPRKSRRRHPVEVRDGYLDPPTKAFTFQQDTGYYASIKIPSRFRATVKVKSVQKGRSVFLTGVTVVLYVKRSEGWKKEYSGDYTLGRQRQRPMEALPGGKRRVRKLSRTLSLNTKKLEAEVKDLLTEGMQKIIQREKGRGR